MRYMLKVNRFFLKSHNTKSPLLLNRTTNISMSLAKGYNSTNKVRPSIRENTLSVILLVMTHLSCLTIAENRRYGRVIFH